jgi:hypothetical protein
MKDYAKHGFLKDNYERDEFGNYVARGSGGAGGEYNKGGFKGDWIVGITLMAILVICFVS